MHTKPKSAPKPFLMAVLLGLASVAILPAAARSQAEASGPDTREEHSKLIDRVRVIRLLALTEALELDETTAAKLAVYLRESGVELVDAHRERREVRRKMAQMVQRDSYDSKTVDELSEALTDLDVRVAMSHAKQTKGLKRILTPKQRVKYALVRGNIDQEVRRTLRHYSGKKTKKMRRGGEEAAEPR